MRKVDIPRFRREIVALIEANRDKLTSFELADDNSIFTFCGKNYACEVTLSDKWIGYDLGIETPKGMAGCGMRNDTDLYPIHGGQYEEVALEIYDDLVSTVKAILSGHMYYTSRGKISYIARKDPDNTYSVEYWKRKNFLFWPYSTGWSKELNEAEFKKLELKVLI